MNAGTNEYSNQLSVAKTFPKNEHNVSKNIPASLPKRKIQVHHKLVKHPIYTYYKKDIGAAIKVPSLFSQKKKIRKTDETPLHLHNNICREIPALAELAEREPAIHINAALAVQLGKINMRLKRARAASPSFSRASAGFKKLKLHRRLYLGDKGGRGARRSELFVELFTARPTSLAYRICTLQNF